MTSAATTPMWSSKPSLAVRRFEQPSRGHRQPRSLDHDGEDIWERDVRCCFWFRTRSVSSGAVYCFISPHLFLSPLFLFWFETPLTIPFSCICGDVDAGPVRNTLGVPPCGRAPIGVLLCVRKSINVLCMMGDVDVGYREDTETCTSGGQEEEGSGQCAWYV